ncbi:dihydroxyacetone kinase phosphoryl donor subunit DhaM [Serinibacter salmoneus]|uniref:Phosphocarrier protein HPr n=1 Tax=Serinibacter salmoneus TaxID=556530 RepID=A0A2A9CZ67_9MICO|nr:dihydroxyacetone kinase phosphoryl donor subunit DhaM [Serinibacter salmoneus]PFG19295.1 PTS hybrid protein [Serinibacter salmoneus]
MTTPDATARTAVGTATVGLVLVSHSALLAAGACELASQMARDVVLKPAGGTDDARLGTSFDVVERAVAAELDSGCTGVVLLADIGSARMTAEAVIDMLEDERVVLAPGPFAEGAVAAAVAAQTGGDIAQVVGAVAAAARQITSELAEAAAEAEVEEEAEELLEEAAVVDEAEELLEEAAAQEVSAVVAVRNPQGLHARPAAQLAQLVAGFDAQVTLNGVNAASLLSLMGLGLKAGSEVTVVAEGPAGSEALRAVVEAFEDGFGEL